MTDQQRSDQVGYAGNSFFETPALDALAGRGVVFEQAYSASSTCVPARSALLTGVQPHRLPTQGNARGLREGTWTLPRALRAVGYQTALVGKMHFSPIHADHGFDLMRTCEHLSASDIGTRPSGAPDFDDYHDWLIDRGVDEYRPVQPGGRARAEHLAAAFPLDASLHPTAWIEQEAGRVLAGRDPDQPLFLVVSFPHPHAPLNPPEPYASRYDPADAVLPEEGFEVNDGLPEAFRSAMLSTTGFYQPRRVESLGARALPQRLTRVKALVRQIDDVMGRLLGRIPLDHALVFFTSDHGDYAGHRGLLQKVPWIPFDDLVRVPLVVAGAGLVGGRRVRSLVQAFDIVPTACDAAGVPIDPAELDATSLWPVLDGGTAVDDERAVVFSTTMGWPGARQGAFKYVRHQASGQAVLFDLSSDPGETTNLLDDPAYNERAFEVALALHLSLERSEPNLLTPTE